MCPWACQAGKVVAEEEGDCGKKENTETDQMKTQETAKASHFRSVQITVLQNIKFLLI